MKKPTVEQVLELYDDTKLKYGASGIFDQWDSDDEYYELDFKKRLGLPAEFADEGIALPTARDIVDVCTDHVDVYNVRIWANRKGTSPKSKEDAELMRKFGLGVLYRNNVEASIAPIRVGAKHYWLYGQTTFKTVWDADRWVDRPTQNEGESEQTFADRIDEWRAEHHDSIPIVIQPIHPKNIMLDLYYEGGTFVFETRKELCFNVTQDFPRWTNPKGKKVSEKVEHISFWTKDFRCELYDREPILPRGNGVVKHTYGFVPYVTIDTGLGNLTADNDLKKRYVGVLRYVRDIVISESRDYSIGDIILKRTAWPWGYITGEGGQNVTELSQKFGQYQFVGVDAEIHDMVPKMPPSDLLTWMSQASSYLAAHAAPNVTRGMGETGVRSGSDRRLLLSEAAMRYTYSQEAFRNGVAKVLTNCARIMKNVVPGDINVWAKTPTDEFDIEIKKDKMKEPFTYYVEFAPVSEEDEYRRHDDLERMYKSGLATKGWSRRQMSNVDPEAMEVEETVEQMKIALAPILGQYAIAKFQEKLNQLEAANNPNVLPPQPMGMPGQPPAGVLQEPGRRMVPPIPNNPALGSAQGIQNELEAQRSQTPMNPMQGQGGGGNRR